MSQIIIAHFDGKVLIPDEPVQLPVGQPLRLTVETSNALAPPSWRAYAVALIDHVRSRPDVVVQEMTPDLWQRGWDLYRNRPDKAWSLTDCISFLVMQDNSLTDALSADEHFRQAG